MDAALRERLQALTTAHLADASRRLGIEVRCGPVNIRGLSNSVRCMGPVRPARHNGSIDVFLEAIDQSVPGDILVIDNGARMDEACIGDLVAFEAKHAGIAGIVIWGLHRDTAELLEIGLPIFSMGSLPAASGRSLPRLADATASARIGLWVAGLEDIVIADGDGVILIPAARATDIAEAAETIRSAERDRIEGLRGGVSLREQLRFNEFRDRLSDEPALNFREHLQSLSSPQPLPIQAGAADS